MPNTSIKLARLHGGTEVFHSIQGEGISMGMPAIFVRASLCNLHCRWCDTDYTWNWEGTPWSHENDADPTYQKFKKDDHIIELSTDEVAEKIAAFPCLRVIITGGEPLLQDEAWQCVIDSLLEKNPAYTFEVETNGTLIPSPALDARVHQYNISPKLANSGNEITRRLQSDTLGFFAHSPKAWFKFVVSTDEDLKEIDSIIATHSLPKDRILLMPEGRDDASLQKHRLWLVEACLKRNYRYTDRLHIQLWGNRRGV